MIMRNPAYAYVALAGFAASMLGQNAAVTVTVDASANRHAINTSNSVKIKVMSIDRQKWPGHFLYSTSALCQKE